MGGRGEVSTSTLRGSEEGDDGSRFEDGGGTVFVRVLSSMA